MDKLQPSSKSFENYIKLAFTYSSINLTQDQLDLIEKLSIIDDSILMIDDILDDSQIRNGKPCYYKHHGIKKSIIDSQILYCEANEVILDLTKEFNTKENNVIIILKKLNSFMKNVYLGEKIDLELINISTFENELLEKYFEMIKLFTGSHISYAFEIGLLLQNKELESNLKKIFTSLGIIRQICDDFDDYFNFHHEPFGDFISSNNRLPELLFKKNNGNRLQVLELLQKNDLKKARDLVLNDKVRYELYQFCKKN